MSVNRVVATAGKLICSLIATIAVIAALACCERKQRQSDVDTDVVQDDDVAEIVDGPTDADDIPYPFCEEPDPTDIVRVNVDIDAWVSPGGLTTIKRNCTVASKLDISWGTSLSLECISTEGDTEYYHLIVTTQPSVEMDISEGEDVRLTYYASPAIGEMQRWIAIADTEDNLITALVNGNRINRHEENIFLPLEVADVDGLCPTTGNGCLAVERLALSIRWQSEEARVFDGMYGQIAATDRYYIIIQHATRFPGLPDVCTDLQPYWFTVAMIRAI